MADRILVAYDESPQATAALQHALRDHPDAEIHVLHVNDPREWIQADSMGGGYYSEAAFEQSQESADALLDEAESIAAEHDAAVTTATRTGRAATAIVDYAEEEEVDHIVLGSHGRTGLSRFLLGSVAETVARRSPASVTIVRNGEEDAEDAGGEEEAGDGE